MTVRNILNYYFRLIARIYRQRIDVAALARRMLSLPYAGLLWMTSLSYAGLLWIIPLYVPYSFIRFWYGQLPVIFFAFELLWYLPLWNVMVAVILLTMNRISKQLCVQQPYRLLDSKRNRVAMTLLYICFSMNVFLSGNHMGTTHYEGRVYHHMSVDRWGYGSVGKEERLYVCDVAGLFCRKAAIQVPFEACDYPTEWWYRCDRTGCVPDDYRGVMLALCD